MYQIHSELIAIKAALYQMCAKTIEILFTVLQKQFYLQIIQIGQFQIFILNTGPDNTLLEYIVL